MHARAVQRLHKNRPITNPADIPFFAGMRADVTPLPGGITNENFLVRCGKKHIYVARIFGADGALLGINRVHEAYNMRRAALHGLAPVLLYVDEKAGALVSAFAPGRIASRVARTERAMATGQALKALHTSNMRFKGTIDVRKVIRAYQSRLRGMGGTVPRRYRPLIDAAHAACRAMRRMPRPQGIRGRVPCHADLMPGNILIHRGRALLIDWEYAAMGDPFFDLALAPYLGDYTPAMTRIFLRTYLGAQPTPLVHAWQSVYTTALAARELLWGLLQDKVSHKKFNYCAYAEQQFRRALALGVCTEKK